MKYVEEFRDGAAARNLVAEITREAARPWTIMEICGGQTFAILRFGIDGLLPGAITLVHGPGCPVCVTPVELIDHFEKATGARVREHIEEVEVATPVTFARYTGVHGGAIYGYEPDSWDSLIPRMMAMNEEKHIGGLEFAGGYAFRCHGYSSSFLSGQIAGLLTFASLLEERG